MDSGDPILFRTDRGSTVRMAGITLYPLDDPVGHVAEAVGDDEHLRLAADADQVALVRPVLQDALSKLAAEALADDAADRTTPLDPEKL